MDTLLMPDVIEIVANIKICIKLELRHTFGHSKQLHGMTRKYSTTGMKIPNQPKKEFEEINFHPASTISGECRNVALICPT